MNTNYNLYLDLKSVSGINQAYKKNTQGLMNLSGVNLGNFAFRHGLAQMHDLSPYRKMGWVGTIDYVEQNGKPDNLLLSCANWLGTSVDDENNNGYRALVIEKMDCPVTAVAIGAQSHSPISEFELGPRTQRLIKVISERSKLVSVRDSFTQEALEKYGITNTIVTGCPSNFINLSPTLGRTIQYKASAILDKSMGLDKARIHLSEYSGGNSASLKVLSKTLEILRQSPSFYVVQSPELLPFLLGESEDLPIVYSTASMMKGKMKASDLLKAKTLHFSLIEAWMDFARTCDISLGMRIHGNMLPLQAGVPSIVIGHDSRTSGLANAMGIPLISADDFCKCSLKNLMPKVLEANIFAMEEYDEKRKELHKNFVQFFEANNIEMKNQFHDFGI